MLEDGDISLSNYVLIGDGLDGPMKERVDLPDEIYLVETAVDRWAVKLMKYDESYLPEGDWKEFDSAELADITNTKAN